VDNISLAENHRHLDYFPLVNARAHKLGGEEKQGILNQNFKATYEKFIKALLVKTKIDNADKLQFVYYLLLQDRLDESQLIFHKIDVKEISETLRMQYDYMASYFDIYTGHTTNYQVARSLAPKYKDYPMVAWRLMFKEILD
jgi:hypothetical protein